MLPASVTPQMSIILKVIYHDVSSNHFVFRFCWQVLGFLVSDVSILQIYVQVTTQSYNFPLTVL